MLKKKNISGILTIASVISLLVLMMIIQAQAEMVKAFYVKLAMVNTTLVFASAGIYLSDAFGETATNLVKRITWYSGAFLVVFAFLVCFDIIPFSKSWNWLVVCGILFILFVQLQLLQWGQRVPHLVRYSALIIMICDMFLVFFFIAKWENYLFGPWINFVAVLSIVLTFVGLVSLRKKKEA